MLSKVGQDDEGPAPVKAFTKDILVERSNTETSGRITDSQYQIRLRDEPTPELMLFPSLIGGWGLFAVEPFRKQQVATEYAGKVLSHTEAVALRDKRNNEASHTRTVLTHDFCLDARIQPEFGLTMEYYVQNQQVTVL